MCVLGAVWSGETIGLFSGVVGEAVVSGPVDVQVEVSDWPGVARCSPGGVLVTLTGGPGVALSILMPKMAWCRKSLVFLVILCLYRLVSQLKAI